MTDLTVEEMVKGCVSVWFLAFAHRWERDELPERFMGELAAECDSLMTELQVVFRALVRTTTVDEFNLELSVLRYGERLRLGDDGVPPHYPKTAREALGLGPVE